MLVVVPAIVVLACQSMNASAASALALVGTVAVACGMTAYILRPVGRHFQAPAAQHYGILLGTLVAAIAFVPALAWINWSAIDYPGELRFLEFRQAVLFLLEERLPGRRGWVAEVLAWAYAIEAVQVSFVARSGVGSLWGVMYAVYLGLVAFLVARSAAAASLLVQRLLLDRSAGRGAKEDAPNDTATTLRPGSKTASRAFWGTITLLVVATIGAASIGISSGARPTLALQGTPETEVTATRLEAMLSASADMALRRVGPEADDLLDGVYAPVYAAIPAFAEFHYSVVGEYIELGLSVVGGLERRLHSDLFSGFDERLDTATGGLAQQFVVAYEAALGEQVDALFADEPLGAVLGEATRIALGKV